jgi:hypothetical protein
MLYLCAFKIFWILHKNLQKSFNLNHFYIPLICNGGICFLKKFYFMHQEKYFYIKDIIINSSYTQRKAGLMDVSIALSRKVNHDNWITIAH